MLRCILLGTLLLICTLELGVQSTNPREIAEIERTKGSDPEKLVRKVAEKISLDSPPYRDHVRYEISLIWGLPHQTVTSFQQSLDWARSTRVARIDAFPLMLLRGTPPALRKAKLGLVEGMIAHPSINRIQSFIPHVVETPSMTVADWHSVADMASRMRDGGEKTIP